MKAKIKEDGKIIMETEKGEALIVDMNNFGAIPINQINDNEYKEILYAMTFPEEETREPNYIPIEDKAIVLKEDEEFMQVINDMVEHINYENYPFKENTFKENTFEGMTAKEIIEKKVKEHYNEEFMAEAQKIQKDIINKANNNDFKGLLSLMKDNFTNQEILKFANKLGVSVKSNSQKAKDKAKKKIANKSKRINAIRKKRK